MEASLLLVPFLSSSSKEHNRLDFLSVFARHFWRTPSRSTTSVSSTRQGRYRSHTEPTTPVAANIDDRGELIANATISQRITPKSIAGSSSSVLLKQCIRIFDETGRPSSSRYRLGAGPHGQMTAVITELQKREVAREQRPTPFVKPTGSRRSWKLGLDILIGFLAKWGLPILLLWLVFGGLNAQSTAPSPAGSTVPLAALIVAPMFLQRRSQSANMDTSLPPLPPSVVRATGKSGFACEGETFHTFTLRYPADGTYHTPRFTPNLGGIHSDFIIGQSAVVTVAPDIGTVEPTSCPHHRPWKIPDDCTTYRLEGGTTRCIGRISRTA